MVKSGVWMMGAAGIVVAFCVGCEDKKPPPAPAPEPKPTVQPTAEPTPTPTPKASAAPLAPVQMIKIPGGSFNMGSSDGQVDEKPVKPVMIQAFEMDLHEVTLENYMACVDDNACTLPDVDHFCVWGRQDKLNHPMNCVDWPQATAYCAWRKKRLPTEEEWEYAARGTDGRAYPWGKPPAPADLCINRPKKGTCEADKVPVDTAWGLKGMAGNVWEWTSSGYNEDYSKRREKERHVYRGGSWYEEKLEDMRATTRNRRAPPQDRLDYLGFRCARTPK
jgi:formylglycine-generating enzyme required for sulfatase activity